MKKKCKYCGCSNIKIGKGSGYTFRYCDKCKMCLDVTLKIANEIKI